MRESYGDVIEQMRARPKRKAPKRGWRDYVTRRGVGFGICIAGLISSAVSGRLFIEEYVRVVEDFGRERTLAITAAEESRDYESVARRDSDLEGKAYLTIGCAVVAAGGYIVARWNPRKQWSPKVGKYGCWQRIT